MKQDIIILHSSGGLEKYYDHASNLLYQYYQNSPTSLIEIPISTEEQGDIAYYNSLVSQLIPSANEPPHTPIGKLVV
ncbi:MAG: hypothetical protein A2Z49_13225 [Chloroflexi bacterium RBG_19FT_COMBO_56_12]|nr:MAG: hypothetical protein A2Z49_13225 [Chloroflexi bacterium RBG_19FT_COMBO_56_12]